MLQQGEVRQRNVGEKLMTTGVKKLTNKLWCPKYVFEFISKVNFMGQPKVDDLDPRFGDISIQKHDVFRLEEKKTKNSTATFIAVFVTINPRCIR